MYKLNGKSDFKVLSRDRAFSFPYKMHVVVFALGPTLGSMQYLDHLKFREYLLGVEREEGRHADGRSSFFDVTLF